MFFNLGVRKVDGLLKNLKGCYMGIQDYVKLGYSYDHRLSTNYNGTIGPTSI